MSDLPAEPQLSYHYHQYRRCGKPDCHRCVQGPGHGPYWYVYWYQEGKLRSQYLGKARPGAVSLEPAAGRQTRHTWKTEEALARVVDYLGAHPGTTGRDIATVLGVGERQGRYYKRVAVARHQGTQATGQAGAGEEQQG